jgi:hypothetical protein
MENQDENKKEYYFDVYNARTGPFSELSYKIGEFADTIITPLLSAAMIAIFIVVILAVLCIPVAAVKYLCF